MNLSAFSLGFICVSNLFVKLTFLIVFYQLCSFSCFFEISVIFDMDLSDSLGFSTSQFNLLISSSNLDLSFVNVSIGAYSNI